MPDHILSATGSREKGLEAGERSYTSLKLTSGDTLPSQRPHFLQVLHPTQTVPPTGAQVFEHMSLWGTLLIQNITMGTPCLFHKLLCFL